MMNDMLSQEEIDALLKGGDDSKEEDSKEEIEELSSDEKDAVGEIGNISMGTAATTLSTLLNQKVSITTPKVSVLTSNEITEKYPKPFVGTNIKYTQGLKGNNLLILKQHDAKIITDLMMGGTGDVEVSDEALSEVHLSAIGEAMNQMVGSSSTSLSEMFDKKIDISPPDPFQFNLQSDNIEDIIEADNDVYVKISFDMKIGELIDSEIMQLIPIDFAKEMVASLMGGSETTETEEVIEEPVKETEVKKTPSKAPEIEEHEEYYEEEEYEEEYYEEEKPKKKRKPVNAQPAEFQSFEKKVIRKEPENISLIRDVPLKVTVELGRTVKKINDVLEFGPGTIIELDKLVGEPLDILVNGQYVAKGEVVVMDENYGIRVTDIVKSEKRLKNL